MALILSSTSGNFNSGATWVGGIVPGAADEARAATTHVITITANVTCTELSNAGTGTYILNSGVTLTANCTHKSTTVSIILLTFSAASPATASIVGNITSGTVTGSTAVTNTGSGTLNVTGNALGGSGGSAAAITSASSGNVTLTGNATGGSGATGAGLTGAATGIFTIIGNVLGGSVGFGAFCNGGSTLNITGNVTAAAAVGVTNLLTGTVTITGNVTAATAVGVNNASTGTLTISGGTYTASTAAHAVSSTNASASVRISGSFIYASNGLIPINSPKFILLTTPLLAKTRYALNGSTTFVDMFTADNSLGQAAIADVRSGTVYASGILTGTLAVPAAGSVALGVPVDAGTGTATLTASDVRAAMGLATANLDTQLAALPTADENADGVWNALLADYTVNNTFGDRVVRSTNSNNELQLTGSHHAAADIHEFQPLVIESAAFATSAVTLFTGAMRTEITPELDEIGEIHAIHGLKSGSALTVTPSSRAAGAITQTIGGDGTTTTTVTRT